MHKWLLTLFAVFSVTSASADLITLRADSWCPYNCDPANSEYLGSLIDVAKVAFEKSGHTVEYQILPWERAVNETRTGKFNGIVGAFHENAPDFIFPEHAQGSVRIAFWVKKTNPWKFTGIDSLKDQVVGVISGYSYKEPMDSYVNKNKSDKKKIYVITGENPEFTGIKMLLAGRFPIFLENEAIMEFDTKQLGVSGELLSVGGFPREPIYIAFSPADPKSKEYAKILSDAMIEMRKSGELKKILDKYDMVDWE
jgi:polar amino acid transport system substrate-binding protein